MKFKSRCNRTNIKLALLSATLLSAEAFAAEVVTAAASAQPIPSTPVVATPVVDTPVFATVGKVIITQREFDVAFIAAARAKFYHGKPPDAEIAVLQRAVGDKLVANILLLREAKRRKLKPDAAAVKQKLEQHEQRYRDNEQWKQARAQELPRLTRQWQEENLLSQLEKLVRKVADPGDKQLREFYDAHLDKFTAPEQQRVSIILLKVDPSSPKERWEEALAEGKDLTARLRAGGDFAEFAREHSGDSSAEEGGDMGYLHSGMLAEVAQEWVNKLKPGEISDPITLMEGVAIFRLTERMPSQLNSFEEVKERARGLWLTEQSELAWTSLIAQLKKKTSLRINELRYLPLPVVAEKPAAKPVATE